MNLVSNLRRLIAGSAAALLVAAGMAAAGVTPAAAVGTPACGQATGQAMCLTIHVSSIAGTDADVTLPLSGMANVYVNWGDTAVTGPLQASDAASHTYSATGDYTINISGTSVAQFGNFDAT